MSENNKVAKRGSKALVELISSDAMKNQWALVLPKCLTADRLARVAITQIRKNPKLGQCTPESFMSSMMVCAEMGLEPNGRDAHLIPYKKECTLIPDYKGLVRLVRRDPNVKDVQVFSVRENDEFKWTPEGITHSFELGKGRGEVIGCYTKISWENGTVSYGEPMDKEGVEKIRKASPSGDSGPWVQWYEEMWKKSVIRRDSKMWPLAAETIDALTIEEAGIEIDVSPPIYDDDPLSKMAPADAEVVEEAEEREVAEEREDPPKEAEKPKKEKKPEPTKEVDKITKIKNSLKTLQKHRPEEFAAECDMLDIPVDYWQDAPDGVLESLFAALK